MSWQGVLGKPVLNGNCDFLESQNGTKASAFAHCPPIFRRLVVTETLISSTKGGYLLDILSYWVVGLILSLRRDHESYDTS